MTIIKTMFMVLWLPLNLFVAVGLIVSAYCGAVDPDRFPIWQLVNMTFPVWSIIAVLLLIVNLFVSRRVAIWIPFVSLLVCGKPLLAMFPLHIVKPGISTEEKTKMFTVLTYNVYNFTDNQDVYPDWGNRTISYIIRENPDIVCLQEAFPIYGQYSRAGKEQQDTLKERYPYYIDTPNRAGEMILSRYPVKLIEVPYSPEWTSGQYTAYRAEIDGHETTIVNCHLQSLGLTSDDKALYRELTDRKLKPSRTELSQAKHNIIPKLLNAFRARGGQIDSISEFVNEIGENVLLMGDFNDVPGSYAYRTMLDHGFRDAYASCAFGPTVTYNDNRFYFRIDHIFYRGDMRAVRIKRGNKKYSDHYPLKATFVWN